MKVLLKNLFRFLLTGFLIFLIVVGIYDYLKNVDTNDCSMTYMKQGPGLIPINLPKSVRKEFPNYKLFLYCEGYDCQQFESMNFNLPGYIPVLFVPGNADSHLQVRSIASVALDKSLKKKYEQRNVKFLYFTISFNEELTAMYGPLLEIQANFVKFSIEHILTFFKNVKPEIKRPKTVVLIGNSMGGIIVRSIFLPSKDNFHKKNLVHTIITQSSPHNHPVIYIDAHMSNYYEKVNNFWLNQSETSLKNVVLASLYGGTRDILVRSGLSNLNEWVGKSNAAIISGFTVSMPFVWRSIDHVTLHY
jgi:GPI inositol-deacylase